MPKKTGAKPAPDTGDDNQNELNIAESVTQALDSMPDDTESDAPASPPPPVEEAPDDEAAAGEKTPETDRREAGEGEGDAGEGKAAEGEEAGKVEGEGEQPKPEEKKAEAPSDEELLKPTKEEQAEWSERTTNRFQTMSGRIKEQGQQLEQVSQERDQIAENYQAVTDLIRRTNAPPDQLVQLFDITGELMSGDVRRGSQGVERAFHMIKSWADYYGVKLPEHSILASYPDLQQKVESGELTQDIAEQHATLRRQQASQQQYQNRQQQSQQQAQEWQSAAHQASQTIKQLESQWTANDADYAQKAGLMNEYGSELAQQVMSGQVHPSRLPALLQERYNTITRTLATLAPMRQQQGDGKQDDPNPMRPGASRSGSGQPVYKTFEEAVTGALKSMR